MCPSKVMRVLVLQKKLLERQAGGAFECLAVEVARFRGHDFARLMVSCPIPFFMFHDQTSVSTMKATKKSGNILMFGQESYHSEQQKLLERIRSLERAAAPGNKGQHIFEGFLVVS